MGHDHHHGPHSHAPANISGRVLLIALGLNVLLTVGQVFAAWVAGSVALLADALHNGSDAVALGIAWIARRVGQKAADRSFTFGYRRAELVGALINLTALVLIAVYLGFEAVQRLLHPVDVLGGWVMAAAGLALLVDAGTVLLLWSQSRGNLNFRAAFYHHLTDAGTSVAVLVGGAVIFFVGWRWIDPALTLLLAGFIGWQSLGMLRQAVRLLMEATPRGIDLDELAGKLVEHADVEGIHHLHVWEIEEGRPSLEAHVVIERGAAPRMEEIKFALKKTLVEDFRIAHATLEFEFAGEDSPCPESSLIAHGCS